MVSAKTADFNNNTACFQPPPTLRRSVQPHIISSSSKLAMSPDPSYPLRPPTQQRERSTRSGFQRCKTPSQVPHAQRLQLHQVEDLTKLTKNHNPRISNPSSSNSSDRHAFKPSFSFEGHEPQVHQAQHPSEQRHFHHSRTKLFKPDIRHDTIPLSISQALPQESQDRYTKNTRKTRNPKNERNPRKRKRNHTDKQDENSLEKRIRTETNWCPSLNSEHIST
ncbi:hypothetical protein F5Y18DRAFT_307496 [Xylariaceae sp. FL1019]|nr:hypothetical protein F5Y18DRAFT_307496 [Xylariaceae sp. FL1019]